MKTFKTNEFSNNKSKGISKGCTSERRKKKIPEVRSEVGSEVQGKMCEVQRKI